ncbi:MAG TPA: sortase [Candidatus Nitrosopolaris sp.]|nr:sortase [Candidatus Nitrosopolaris sp.]
MYPRINLMLKKSLSGLKSLKASLLIGLAALLVGLAVLANSLYSTWRAQQSAVKPVKQAFANTQVISGQPTLSGTPTHISIPSVGIDLQVIPGYFNAKNNSWTLSLSDAQYATVTAPANNKKGLTFIYGHYRLHVFYTLPKVQPGALAIVTTDNGHTFTYTFRDSVITSPNDTSLFSYQGKPILVLQTCTGLWYQNRQLFTFDLTKAA